MDKKSLSFLFVGLLGGALAASIGYSYGARHSQSGGGGTSTQSVVLRLAHSLKESHPVHAGMVYMATRLEELSGGEVRLRIFPNGQLGDERECLEQVQSGILDITKISAAPMEAFVPQMAVLSLPYIFHDTEHLWSVLDGDVGSELLAAGEPHGLLGLCYYDAGARSFYTSDQPVMSPDDLVGMKIRVLQSDTAIKLVDTLGGSPTPVAWGELYTALQQGMVDGAENNPPSYLTSRHFEVAKHYSLDEHSRIPDVLVISSERWHALPERLQNWIKRAAADSSRFQRELWAKESDAAIAEVEAQGVTIYRPDQSPFAQRVKPMLDGLEDPQVRALLERIQASR